MNNFANYIAAHEVMRLLREYGVPFHLQYECVYGNDNPVVQIPTGINLIISYHIGDLDHICIPENNADVDVVNGMLSAYYKPC